MREIRCFPAAESDPSATLNSWAGSPTQDHVGPFWVVRAVIEGPVDPRTGYVCNIRRVEAMLREVVVPALRKHAGVGPTDTGRCAQALVRAFLEAADHAPENAELAALEWRLTPFLRLLVKEEMRSMVLLTQSFEFSAAHRLACKTFTDEENRRVFGKCAHPHGHGHNYQLEVTVVGRPDEVTGRVIDLARLERIVNQRVIDAFDHKHLNLDCEEFASLNPSVENIAKVIWDRLAGEFGDAQLARVRVWETPKTFAEYSGGA